MVYNLLDNIYISITGIYNSQPCLLKSQYNLCNNIKAKLQCNVDKKKDRYMLIPLLE